MRGLARRATMLLRDRGFDVVEMGTRQRRRATRRSCSTSPAIPIGRIASRSVLAPARVEDAHATAHATWISPSFLARRGARRPSRSTRSWPHAAAMSMPRLFRTATSTPLRAQLFREYSNAIGGRRREAARAAGMQRNEVHERAALAAPAAPAESRAPIASFTPPSITYSNVTRRSNTFAASITSASGYFVLIGISSRRSASFGAWIEIARRNCSGRSPERDDAGQHADGGDGDVPRADAEPVRIVENRERRVDRLPVHERLAHAHEHDVRHLDRRIEQAHLAHLTGDLERASGCA